jgi:hypothetical protein
MKTIEKQLLELGFRPGPNFARSDYIKDSLHVEIFDTNYVYMVATVPGQPCVWCGAHFPPTVPVAVAIAIVTEHQQALEAAVVTAAK